MTNYQLYVKSGVPKSTIGNLVNCTYDSVKLREIHEVCQEASMLLAQKLFFLLLTNYRCNDIILAKAKLSLER